METHNKLKVRDGLRVTPAGGSDRLAAQDAYNAVHIRKTMTRTTNTSDTLERQGTQFRRNAGGRVNLRCVLGDAEDSVGSPLSLTTTMDLGSVDSQR